MLESGAATSYQGGRIRTLDGFRAIAVAFVVLSHIGFERWVPGQFGVTLFFFLSGYLITTLLRTEYELSGRLSFRQFYLRRAVRILPPMWVAIALAVAMNYLGWIEPLNLEWLPADLLFLSNYLPHSSIPIGLWSLAIEEHYYLFFPLLALVCYRRGGRARLAIVCASFCVLELAVRLVLVDRVDHPAQLTFFTHTRLDSILFGALLALVANPVVGTDRKLMPKYAGYIAGVAILAATFVIRDEWFRSTIRFTLQGLGLMLLFGSAIRDRGPIANLLDSRPLRSIAAMSYVIYLTHVVFVEASLRMITAADAWVRIGIGLSATLAFSWLSLHYFEGPLGGWRRKIERRWKEPTLNGDARTDPTPGRGELGEWPKFSRIAPHPDRPAARL